MVHIEDSAFCVIAETPSELEDEGEGGAGGVGTGEGDVAVTVISLLFETSE